MSTNPTNPEAVVTAYIGLAWRGLAAVVRAAHEDPDAVLDAAAAHERDAGALALTCGDNIPIDTSLDPEVMRAGLATVLPQDLIALAIRTTGTTPPRPAVSGCVGTDELCECGAPMTAEPMIGAEGGATFELRCSAADCGYSEPWSVGMDTDHAAVIAAVLAERGRA